MPCGVPYSLRGAAKGDAHLAGAVRVHRRHRRRHLLLGELLLVGDEIPAPAIDSGAPACYL